MKIPDFVKALLVSRKFWLAVIGVIGMVFMYIKGLVTAEMLADAIVSLVAIVILAIAGEDMASKVSGVSGKK